MISPNFKATSHSTVFDIPMRLVYDDQRHRRRFTRQRQPATPVMVIIPLNFASCTLPTHRNCQVKSSHNLLTAKAWFPLHDKCQDHDTKTKRL